MTDLFTFLSPFHFIRPHWFYALIPALLLFIWLFLKKQNSANWSKICDPELLDYFLVENTKTASRYPLILLLLGWLLAIFSLAGPSWEKIETPIYTNQNALVIILDLSLSMNASDLKPSRLERAKHKLTDILTQRKEGQTALIVYAGDAHIVSPLTPDNKTILSFVPVLNSSLMPVPGSNLNKALIEAENLFKNSGIKQGKILLLSDGINSTHMDQLSKTMSQLKKSGYSLSVIGVGTEDGAPIPKPLSYQEANQEAAKQFTEEQSPRGFIKDKSGNIVLSKLNQQQLKQLTTIGAGVYQRMTITDQDFKSILSKTKNNFKKQMKKQNEDEPSTQEQLTQEQLTQEQWSDKGSLFVLFILPFALLLFRKGWLLCLLVIILPLPYQPAYSMQWNDLWQRADQQGMQAFSLSKNEMAAEKFNDPQWKGSSFYKAGNYQQAIEQFSKSDSLQAKYNTANSLAKLKRLDEAVKAYDEVLEKDPKHQDSLNNKKIVEDLIKKQQQDKKDQKNKDNKDSKDGKDKDKNHSDKNKDNKDSDQKKQDKDQQPSDKGDQEQQDKNQSESKSEQQQKEQQEEHKKQKQAEQEALKNQKEKQEKEQKDKQAQAEQKKKELEKEKEDEIAQSKESLFDKLSDEEKQSMQQYLQQVKDDPAYLLRRKFYLNSVRLKQQNPNTNNNQAEQPW